VKVCSVALSSRRSRCSGVRGRKSGRAARRLAQRARLSLDVPLVPEREREQPPELAREVLLAAHVPVDHPLHGLRVEEALPPNGLGA
jgi:hypothetical protein